MNISTALSLVLKRPQSLGSCLALMKDKGFKSQNVRSAIRYHSDETRGNIKTLDDGFMLWVGIPTVTVKLQRAQMKLNSEDHTSAVRKLLLDGFSVLVDDDGQKVRYHVSAQLAEMVRV